MRRALGLAAAVAALVAFVAFAYTMNSGDVDFRLVPTVTYRMPLGLLLVATLVFGVLIAVVAVAFQQLNQRFSTWSERRKARQEAQIEELKQSGAALAWGGETVRSRSVLKKAWRRDPHNKEAALALAASYSDTGEYDAAKQVLEDAVARESADPDLRYALGEALSRYGHTDEAIRMHETVRVQYPHAARVMVSLRDLYAASGRWADAAEVQQQYIAELASSEGIEDQRDRLRDFRYRATMQIDDPALRIERLEALLAEHRNYAPAIDSLGDAMLEIGKTADALKLWEKAFKREPRIELAERMLDHQANGAGRQRVVVLINKQGDRLDADAARVLRARAAIQDDALESAQHELETVSDPTSAAVQSAWADLHHKRGDTERAWQTVRPLVP